jgi:origin recognition complex subunit 3
VWAAVEEGLKSQQVQRVVPGISEWRTYSLGTPNIYIQIRSQLAIFSSSSSWLHRTFKLKGSPRCLSRYDNVQGKLMAWILLVRGKRVISRLVDIFSWQSRLLDRANQPIWHPESNKSNMSLNGEDDEVNVAEDEYDASAHQGCYIFRASEAEAIATDSRPKKRRKISKSKHVDTGIPSFPKLLGGQENDSSTKLRQAIFERLWSVRQSEIDDIIAEPSHIFIESIAQFVRNASRSEAETKLPTGLVVVGKDSGAQQRLLHQWQGDKRTKASEYLIQLDHNQAANIHSGLKSIIRSVISSSLGQEGYAEFLTKHKRLIPMNFDLELLQRFAGEQDVEKVVISVLDVEAFDIAVLSDMMSMLASWTDRIPFVLLIGISTTVELFEARLPKSVIGLLKPQEFDLSGHSSNPMYKIFMATQQATASDGMLWLGPAAANALLERSQEQETTPEMFGRMVKYTYMSHFFANYLSVLADPGQELDKHTESLVCEAARNTPSFMDFVETTLATSIRDKASKNEVENLLGNNQILMKSIRTHVAEGQDKMAKHYAAVTCLKEMILSLRRAVTVQGQGVPGYDLIASSVVPDDIFEASVIALAGPDAVEIILENLSFHETLEKLSADTFYNFLCSNTDTTIFPLMNHRALKSLQQRTKALLPADSTDSTTYRTILTTFTTLIITSLKTHLIDPTTLPFHEIFIYNSKTPLTQVFAPTPRYAIERALDRPADYLGCECCNSNTDDANNNSATQPPTSILWKLWCEAGSVVNARDLWEAFRGAMIPRDQDQDQEPQGEGEEVEEGGNERRVLALFYRSLAELQMLGMVKMSKRKPGVECLAKIVWRGM